MATIYGANTLSSAYDVANSCRFNSADSASLKDGDGSAPAGNRQKFTFSVWFKRAKLGVTQMFAASSHSSSDEGYLYISGGDVLVWHHSSSGMGQLVTTQKFRDVSAWYHLVWSVDTTQGTASNRMKFYINGTQITAFGTETYPDQNKELYWNVGGSYYPWIGRRHGGDYWDGYLAEIVHIDNAQLDPTSFGEFDSNSPNVWKPIDVSGLTFGTAGYYLDFEDSSEFGKDVSGQGNHFGTVANIAATDQSTDTCTNNFAVCNSSDSFSTGGTFSDGSLTTQSTTSNRGIFTATMGVSTGKWYWEIKTSASGGTHASDEWNYIGIANNIGASNTDNILATSGTDSNAVYEYAIHGHDGDFYNNGDQGTYAASFTTNDILGIFLDLDNNKIYWSKNGQWADGSGNSDEADPNGYKSVTDPASTPGGFYFPAWGDGGSNMNKTWQLNFGGTPGFSVSSGNADPNGYGNFEYPTEGGYALCTKNLAEFG